MTDLSPAERYAASRTRGKSPVLEAFRAHQRFDLDAFQIEACGSIENGRSVLVAAPTGAGKTIVAEFAIYLAMQDSRDKVFYTAPMKRSAIRSSRSSFANTEPTRSDFSPATRTSTPPHESWS